VVTSDHLCGDAIFVFGFMVTSDSLSQLDNLGYHTFGREGRYFLTFVLLTRQPARQLYFQTA
jgi:hypothetical protein